MKRITIVIMTLALSAFFWGSTYAQGNYQVKKGERPPIDISRAPKDAYYHNTVRVKVNSDYESKIAFPSKDFEIEILGIESIDELNNDLGLSRIDRTFPVNTVLDKRFEKRHKDWGFHLWFEFTYKNDQNIVELVSKLNKMKEVELAEPVFKKQIVDYNPNGFVEIDFSRHTENVSTKNGKWVPNDPRLNEQWHYNNTGQQGGTPGSDIDLFAAWDIQKGNPDVIVAIIDGGIDHNHADIQANMWSGIGYNFVNNSTNIEPHNHGTHVAGTVAAVNNNGIGVAGVAGGSGGGNGVRLMSCQVFASSSSGGFSVAPVWAADNGAVISQNSWGYTSAGYYEQSVLDAIDYFNLNAGSEPGSPLSGGITIFAAGNSYSSGQWYPGYYSGAMAVAATNNQDMKSWYSNFDTWVEISAPGGETNTVTQRGVLSTLNGNTYGFYQGTSMACPHVSGVAALVVSHIPGELSADELRDLLKETTDNHYAVNPTYTGMLGTGRLNAASALGEAEAYLTGLRNPKDFMALAISADEIHLSWTRNENLNSVILAYNTVAQFGVPEPTMQVGESIPGGGQILFLGFDTTFNHTELEGVTPYFYRIWSFNEEGEVSTGRGAFATTLCSNFNLPFAEDLSQQTFPMCWSTAWVGSGSVNVWSVTNTANAGGISGEFRARYASSTGTSRLVSPAINTMGVAQVTLRFRHFFDDYSSGLVFKVQTSNDGEQWTDTEWSFSSGNGNIASSLVEFDISDNLNSENTYIAFTIVGNHFNFDYWYIDDVEIEGMPTGAPLVVTIDAIDITETSALLRGNITSQGDEPVTSSGFVYSTSPNPQIGNPNTIVIYNNPLVSEGDFSYGITNLSPASTYFFRSFATNSIATTYGSQKEFTTLCGIVLLPYEQYFSTTELPACWENLNNGGTVNQTWKFGSFSQGLSGSTSYAYLNSDAYGNGNNQNADLISPPINVVGYESVTIKFKHYFRQYSSASTATVSYSVDGGVTWEFLQNWTQTTANPANFEQLISITEGSVTEILIRWNFTGSWAYYWCVDDVEITGVVAGDPPVVTTLSATDVSSTSATLNGVVNPSNLTTTAYFNWGISNVEENQIVYEGQLEGEDDIEIELALENLLPGKQYQFRAKASNLGGITLGETLTFNTITDKPMAGELIVQSFDSRMIEVAGSIISNGGLDLLVSGICVSTSPDPTPSDLFYEISGIEGTFTVAIFAFVPNSTYYFRLYLENDLGSVYSNEVIATTLLEVPEVITLQTNSITSNAAILVGELSALWNTEYSSIGFVMHTDSEFEKETEGAIVLEIEGEVEEGALFEISVFELLSETTYYYRAFADNTIGVGYGEIISFQTRPTGIDENSRFKLNVYPNPAREKVNIVSQNGILDNVAVYSSTGSLIYMTSINSDKGEIDVSRLSPGVYIIKVQYSGANMQFIKVIKQ